MARAYSNRWLAWPGITLRLAYGLDPRLGFDERDLIGAAIEGQHQTIEAPTGKRGDRLSGLVKNLGGYGCAGESWRSACPVRRPG